jgi:DNA-binding CsgD family transcriptional regulator
VIGPDGDNYIVHVLPLTSGVRRTAGVAHAATAAIFIRRAELDFTAPIAGMVRRYRLTPAETKVLRALLEQAGMPSIAAAIGTSTSTVKTHLLNMFEKTGTSTQADLIKLALSFADPLAPGSVRQAGTE